MASAVIVVVFFIAITNFNTIFFFQNLIHSLSFILKIFLIFFQISALTFLLIYSYKKECRRRPNLERKGSEFIAFFLSGPLRIPLPIEVREKSDLRLRVPLDGCQFKCNG